MLAERVKCIYSDVPSRIDHVSADAVPGFIVSERRSAPFLMTRVYAYYSVALATVDAAYYQPEHTPVTTPARPSCAIILQFAVSVRHHEFSFFL